MNPFTTDHPLMSECVWISKCTRRIMILLVLIYPLYLVLLGPATAIAGRGYLNFTPENIRFAIYLPAYPVLFIPGINHAYASYLACWDPNPAETTP